MNKALGYQRLRRHGRAFGRLTGVTPAVVEEIIERLRPAWLKRERCKKKSGRPHGMDGLEEQLMGLLIYYRFYTTRRRNCPTSGEKVSRSAKTRRNTTAPSHASGSRWRTSSAASRCSAFSANATVTKGFIRLTSRRRSLSRNAELRIGLFHSGEHGAGNLLRAGVQLWYRFRRAASGLWLTGHAVLPLVSSPFRFSPTLTFEHSPSKLLPTVVLVP